MHADAQIVKGAGSTEAVIDGGNTAAYVCMQTSRTPRSSSAPRVHRPASAEALASATSTAPSPISRGSPSGSNSHGTHYVYERKHHLLIITPSYVQESENDVMCDSFRTLRSDARLHGASRHSSPTHLTTHVWTLLSSPQYMHDCANLLLMLVRLLLCSGTLRFCGGFFL